MSCLGFRLGWDDVRMGERGRRWFVRRGRGIGHNKFLTAMDLEMLRTVNFLSQNVILAVSDPFLSLKLC